MFFEDISAFVAVVRAGSFSKAAIDLCTAQSALSRRVKRIESRMGTLLLERSARGVILTEAGKMFLSRVEIIVDEISDMEKNLSSFVKEPAGKVRIAFPPRSSGLLAPRVYKRKLASLPLGQLEFLEGTPSQVHGWLSRGEVDIALVYNSEIGPDYDVMPVMTERLHLFCDKKILEEIFNGSIPSELLLKDLPKIPLILPSKPHILRVMIDRLCVLNNIRPNIVFETDGSFVTRGMVEQGIGGTIFSLSTSWSYAVETGQVEAVPFKSPLVCWNLYLVKSRKSPNLLAINKVYTILQQEIDYLLEKGAWSHALKWNING